MKKFLLGCTFLLIATLAWASISVQFNIKGTYSTTAMILGVPTAQLTTVPDPANFGSYLANIMVVQGGSAIVSEQILITGKNSSNSSVTVQRGYNGTTAKPIFTQTPFFVSASLTGTLTPTPTITNTPTPVITNTPGNTATNTATKTATNSATNTRTNTATQTATKTPTQTATNSATNTPTNTATSTLTPTPTPFHGTASGSGTTPVTVVRTFSAGDGIFATYSSPCTACIGPLQAYGLGVTAIAIVPSTGTIGVWNSNWLIEH